jgi:hypothetical protein
MGKTEDNAQKLSSQVISCVRLKSDFHNIFHNLPVGLHALLEAFSLKVKLSLPGLPQESQGHPSNCVLQWPKYLAFEGP